VLCSAAASIITGTALVATRHVVMQADGLTVATLRYVIAAVCLLPLAPIFHGFDVARAMLRRSRRSACCISGCSPGA